MKKVSTAFLQFLMCSTCFAFRAPLQAEEKPRVVVLTDFYKDPDDKQSMIRFLVYANEVDIEGLIATSLAFGTGEVHPEWISDLIDDYGLVLPNLQKHERTGFEFPTVDHLKSTVRAGAPVIREWVGHDRGFSIPDPPGDRDSRSCDPAEKWIGSGKDTDASRHIIDVVDRDDPRPVWVVVWGGAMDLAQALWRVRNERTMAETEAFVDKLGVYQISWQDTGAVWIWDEFPRLFMIQSSEALRGMYEQGQPAHRDQGWVDANITSGHGPLGSQYPKAGRTDGVKEGDTPSFLYLLAAGVSDPEHPEWGGWGGRFRPYGNGTRFFIDDRDAHPELNTPQAEKQWTVGRWNLQRNNDFAARMDWCVRGETEANHNPVVYVNGDTSTAVLQQIAVAGESVSLSATGTNDPDEDELRFKWWQYREAGSYRGAVEFANAGSAKGEFIAPRVSERETLHVVLEVTDNGQPPLTSYRRVIVTVDPAG